MFLKTRGMKETESLLPLNACFGCGENGTKVTYLALFQLFPCTMSPPKHRQMENGGKIKIYDCTSLSTYNYVSRKTLELFVPLSRT
jgi:hypothetical protein